MPRSNMEPINCCDCRFQILGECRRNPPTAMGYWISQRIEAYYPRTDDIEGCFAGELISQKSEEYIFKKSCLNCAEGGMCDVENEAKQRTNARTNLDWHCSDWKQVEVSE